MYFTLGCLFILHHVSYIQPSLSHSQSRRLVQALTTWAVGKNPNWSVDLQSLLDIIQPLHCHQIEFSKIKLNFSQKVPPPRLIYQGFLWAHTGKGQTTHAPLEIWTYSTGETYHVPSRPKAFPHEPLIGENSTADHLAP